MKEKVIRAKKLNGARIGRPVGDQKLVQARIPAELHKAIAREARLEMVSISVWVRQLIGREIKYRDGLTLKRRHKL